MSANKGVSKIYPEKEKELVKKATKTDPDFFSKMHSVDAFSNNSKNRLIENLDQTRSANQDTLSTRRYLSKNKTELIQVETPSFTPENITRFDENINYGFEKVDE
jgi:hypothetical protein